MHPLRVLYVIGLLTVTIFGGAYGFVSHAASTIVKPRLLRLDAVSASNTSGKGSNPKARASPSAKPRAVASRHSRSPPQAGLCIAGSGRPRIVDSLAGLAIDQGISALHPEWGADKAPWLADVVASWFKLPSPKPKPSLSGASGLGTKGRTPRTTRDDIRADIRELRVSNAELREEVLALRNSMIQRGYIPLDDIFAEASTKTKLSGDKSAGNPQQPPTSPSEDSPKPKPPAELPREARLAALVVLWGAAVAIGGVFVPIAIGVGAARSLRWLDDGGTLNPNRWRRRVGFFGDGQGQPGAGPEHKRNGWRQANSLSYVPAMSCMPRDVFAGGEGDGDVVMRGW